jgi:nucleotidyltransferase AbiEii toxin of type IV toxin-antitoxin system
MRIDIGFGDVVTPGVVEIEYPTLLEFSAPILWAYPKETVVAEKLEALTALGMLNSRMKDYCDLWALSRLYGFDGPILLKAIKATFARRAAAVEAQPVGLEEDFAIDEAKSAEWTAFIRRSRLTAAPACLTEVVSVVGNFVYPLLSAAGPSIELGRENLFRDKKKLTSTESLPARRSASRKFRIISGSSASWSMIWGTSIWTHVHRNL